MDISLFDSHAWTPLARFGLTGICFQFNLETLIYTWIALAVLVLFAALGRWALHEPESIPGHVTLKILYSFSDIIEQAINRFVEKYFFFIGSLFSFIFICNVLVLIPGFEEPTQDLNTTLALGLITFFYTQKEALIAHGLLGYIRDFFAMPFTLFPTKKITFLSLLTACCYAVGNILTAAFSFPLEVLGKITSVISLSLRLFGNIFGSAIISNLFKQATAGSKIVGLMGILANINIGLAIILTPTLVALILGIYLCIALFFGLFEAFIQAFVFSVLSITYIGLSIQKGQTTNESSS